LFEKRAEEAEEGRKKRFFMAQNNRNGKSNCSGIAICLRDQIASNK
jgi:hypothetical protein